MNQSASELQFSTKITWILVGISLFAGIFLVLLFTELGQLLNLPSEWLYAIHPNLGWISILMVIAALFVLYQHFSSKFLSGKLIVSYMVVILGCVFVTNYFVPYIWLRGHHHSAEFITIPEADKFLDDDADTLVLEINGEARAYPRDWMMLPHIAGDTVGGEKVAMTYCALTNLPLAVSSSIDGEEANLKVVSQVHNNLVMVDTNSGELYQQITASSPNSDKRLNVQSVQRMPWHSFKSIYPGGKVFRTVSTGLLGVLDNITYALFINGLEPHYTGPDPLFPTLKLDDDRLPAKEKIWGINLEGETVAFTRHFLEQNPIYNTTIGGKPVVTAWFPEYETLGVFSRQLDDQVIKVSSIDVYGNTDGNKLKRVPQYPHALWMVWSHWFPQTKVMN